VEQAELLFKIHRSYQNPEVVVLVIESVKEFRFYFADEVSMYQYRTWQKQHNKTVYRFGQKDFAELIEKIQKS